MDKTNICVNCVIEAHLKEFIKANGKIDICTFCHNQTKVCDSEEEDFYQFLKALVRYHYDEWEYNDHWGGESLHRLIESNDIFFNRKNFTNKDDIEILLELIDSFEAYQNYDKGISLFAGYDKDGNQHFLLRALKKEIDREIQIIISKLKYENYFEFEETIINRLKSFSQTTNINISKDEIFYRARIGYSKKEYDHLSGGMEGKYIYTPYTHKEISNPPPYVVESGRLNRTGVSFLYCATNLETAISEVRPHPGDKVSIGCFKTKQDLNILDFSKNYLIQYYQSDLLLDKSFLYLNTLNKLFQKTIPPSKKDNYSITQIIADCVRKIGFDGVIFRSSIGTGNNIVIFHPNKMEYIDNDSSVIEVENVSYKYSKVE